MSAHLICRINHPNVIPLVISILRVFAEHARVRGKVLGNVRVRLHVGGTGYIAHSFSVWMAGIPTITVRFSGVMGCVGWITGFIILPQFLQHIHRAVLPLILHMRYQVLRLVSQSGKEALLLDTAQFSGLEIILMVLS